MTVESLAFDTVADQLEQLSVPETVRSFHSGGVLVRRYAHDVLGWNTAVAHETSGDEQHDSALFDVGVIVASGEGGVVRDRLRHVAHFLRPTGALVLVVGAETSLTLPLLESVLTDAGFSTVRVVEEGVTTVVVATRGDGAAVGGTVSHRATDARAEFCAMVARESGLPDDARLAMAVRHYRAVVNRGLDAREVERELFAWIRDTYGVDCSKPRSVDLERLSSLPLSGVAASASFAAGMRRVVHRHSWAEAVDYFANAEVLVERRRREGRSLDRDMNLIAVESPPHRLLGLLHTDPSLAMSEWRRSYQSATLNDRAQWTVRFFVEASGAGHGNLFATELDTVAEAIAALSAEGGAWHSMAAVNGAYLLARAAVAQGDRWCATQWASVAEQVLDARRAVLDSDWRARTLHMMESLRGAIGQIRARALPSVVPMPSPDHEAMLWESADHHEVSGAVSVIMAYYRGERYVRAALESIASQTLTPMEVILVDDGSPSAIPKEALGASYPFRLRVVRQGNAGQSAARNTGIRAARGEFIAFLDQDDHWNPDHLATLVPIIASEPRHAWVYSDFEIFDADDATVVGSYLVDKNIRIERPTIADLVATDIMALPSASVMRRRALMEVHGFDRRLSGYEDDELFIRLRLSGWSQAPVMATTIRYRVHGGNSSASVSFQRSRLIFLTIMTTQLAGDGAASSSDVALLGERLLKSTLSDYLRLLTSREDVQARVAARVVRLIGESTGVRVPYSRLGLYLLERPAITRGIFAVLGRLPAAVRRNLISEGILRNYRTVQREVRTRSSLSESAQRVL